VGGRNVTLEFSISRMNSIDDAADLQALTDVLVATVDGGASISFMAPLSRAKAEGFWQGIAPAVARGERALLVARDDAGMIVGSVQLVLAQPENQPHRADVAKMLVHPRARRVGMGAALMRAAEETALAEGKTLLVLDTEVDGAASRLYTRLGWVRVGEVPGYALLPYGGLVATTIFYKRLSPPA
jgi:ribosomal protein S18 acetylase RimI-like enzyme